MEPLPSDNANPVERTQKRENVRELEMSTRFRRLVLAEKRPETPVIMLRGIDVIQDSPVTFLQCHHAHRRNNIGRSVHIVPRRFRAKTAFLLHALVESCSGGGLQQADHGRHDSAPLDEIYLPLEDGGPIVIETDDESALHLEPRTLDSFHVFDKVPVPVLDLTALGQAVLVRGFDADEDFVESGFRPSGPSRLCHRPD